MGSPLQRQLVERTGAPGGSFPRSPLLNPFMMMLPQELWNKVKEPWYPSIDIALGASLPGQGTFQVDGNSWFCILGQWATVRDTTNATVITNVPQLAQIEVQTSGQKFYSRPTDFLNVFGTAQEPVWFTVPRIINPAATVELQLTNLEATARNVRATWAGIKIYNRDIQDLFTEL